jgi:2-C-methyl-D-erythritol 2,4-cyclodiphosphate synthase
MKIRVGMGYDVHPLKEGRPCVLGGVQIESTFGPDGHSDADVLIHAICDALLGAANMRDIGFHFPNTEVKWKGVSSLILLTEVCRLIREKGWEIQNIDATLALEAPKVNPHVPAMQAAMAEACGVLAEDISVKATTNEKLGYVGRQEGVNAWAVALLAK